MSEPSRPISTDLVTRLRTKMKHSAAYSTRENEVRLIALGQEAADEIERLRWLIENGETRFGTRRAIRTTRPGLPRQRSSCIGRPTCWRLQSAQLRPKRQEELDDND